MPSAWSLTAKLGRSSPAIRPQLAEEPVTTADYFEDLRGRLRAVLIRLADQLPAETAGFVDELIDSNECRLALETMSEVVAEIQGRIDSETLEMVRALAASIAA